MDMYTIRKINELEQEVFELQTETEELKENLKELTKLVANMSRARMTIHKEVDVL